MRTWKLRSVRAEKTGLGGWVPVIRLQDQRGDVVALTLGRSAWPKRELNSRIERLRRSLR